MKAISYYFLVRFFKYVRKYCIEPSMKWIAHFIFSYSDVEPQN